MRRAPDSPLTPGRAALLGLLHSPAELLPVSSSAHLELVPALAGWGWERVDPGLRKAFEVAVHAGSAAGIAVALRRELWEVRPRDARAAARLGLAAAPAAVAGYALERPIERRLRGPRALSAGLAAGAFLLAWADAAPGGRRVADERPGDAAWIGLAQAAALAPGISRSGATIAAARRRGFAPADAAVLSRRAGLPVVAGAALLKAVRLRRADGRPAGAAAALAAGAGAALACGLATAPLARAAAAGASLRPWVVYRLALAAAAALGGRRRPGPARAT